MECWYKDCFHSSSRNECSFRVMPSNECQKKIWLRYASVTRLSKSKTPVICSCHFTETSENPIPYFESKRKAQLDDNDNLQPKVKHGKIINQETSLDRFQDSIEVVTNDIFEGERADEELGIENYLEDSGSIVNEHEAYCIEDCVENDINDISSTSDKKIVEHCGITTRLHVGDSVLGDKGFLVKDVLPYGVNLNLPPFLTTPQFTREEVRRTEVIARARIHIERAINRVKNFRILKYIPSEMFFMASEVFQVCVALTNFQYPLVGEIAMRL